MQIIAVDERTNYRELSDPASGCISTNRESTTFGGVATYDITGADVLQVIDWHRPRPGVGQCDRKRLPHLLIAYVPGSATSDATGAPWSGCLAWTATTPLRANNSLPNGGCWRRTDRLGCPRQTVLHRRILHVARCHPSSSHPNASRSRSMRNEAVRDTPAVPDQDVLHCRRPDPVHRLVREIGAASCRPHGRSPRRCRHGPHPHCFRRAIAAIRAGSSATRLQCSCAIVTREPQQRPGTAPSIGCRCWWDAACGNVPVTQATARRRGGDARPRVVACGIGASALRAS